MSDTVKGIEVNENLTKAINSAIDPESIKQALIAEAQAQGLTRADGGAFVRDTTQADAQAVADKAAIDAKAAADKAAADASATGTQPSVYSRTETLGGREFTFEAESQAELDQMVLNAYRVASAVSEPQAVEDVVDPAVARAAEEAEIARKSELELKFRRNEITTQEYLEQTGAVAEYLASQGVPVDALKKTVEAQELHAVEQSWGEAVEAFLHSPAGADWPGGDNNKDMIGLQISALGLIDATDKVGALAQAYQVMKQRNMIFQPNAPAVDPITARASAEKQADDAAKLARAQAEAAAAAGAQRTQQVQHQTQQVQRPAPVTQSSSLWGSSSGTSANDMRDRSAIPQPAAQIIPADARPDEILAAWKAGLVANGQNPDAAFIDTFKSKR